jgi:hypothetical protein
VPGWLAKGQSVRRHARDDTLRLKRRKDRKLSVGCGEDPFWDVTGEGSLKDLVEPCGSCGIGKPPEDQADGEPAGAAPFVLELAIAHLDECSPAWADYPITPNGQWQNVRRWQGRPNRVICVFGKRR